MGDHDAVVVVPEECGDDGCDAPVTRSWVVGECNEVSLGTYDPAVRHGLMCEDGHVTYVRAPGVAERDPVTDL